MRQKYILFLIIFLLPSVLMSEFSVHSDKIIRSLEDRKITYQNLALPIELNQFFVHILPSADKLGLTPLLSIDVAVELSGKLRKLDRNNVSPTFESLFREIKINNINTYFYDNLLSATEIDNALGIKTDSVFGFIGGSVFRRYVAPLIVINRSLTNDYLITDSDRLKILRDYSATIVNIEKHKQADFLGETPFDSKLSVEDLFFMYASGMRTTNIFSSGVSLYQSLLNYATISLGHFKLLEDSIKTVIVQTSLGTMALGGITDDIYEGDFVFILDIGGNDVYKLNSVNKSKSNTNVRYIIDFKGDDKYIGSDFSIASSFFGINIILDLEGNDYYKAGDYSIASSIFGFSLLHDFAGNDKYESGNFSQAAAAFGMAILIDESGDDEYLAASQSQGFGFTRGFGALVDKSGNDLYKSNSSETSSFAQGAACGFGLLSASGIGILADFEGDDKYYAGNYSQGASNNSGFGFLLDFDGNDNYSAKEYSQGFGELFALGMLLDFSGNDVLKATNYSQAFSRNYGMGLLCNYKGANSYYINNLSFENIEFSNSYLFYDIDSTSSFVTADTLTKADDLRRFLWNSDFFIQSVSPQLCFEEHFSAYYSTPKLSNPVNFLCEYFFEDIPVNVNLPIFNIDITLNAGDSSFSGIATYKQAFTLPAEIPVLMNKLSSTNKTHRTELYNLLSNLYDDYPFIISKLLVDSLFSDNYFTFTLATKVLSDKQDTIFVKNMKEFLFKDDWVKRLAALNYFLAHSEYVEDIDLSVFIGDENKYVSSVATYNLARRIESDLLKYFKLSTNSEHILTRNAGLLALFENQVVNISELYYLFTMDLPMEQKYILARKIPEVRLKSREMRKFHEAILQLDEQMRIFIYLAIIESQDTFWLKELKHLLKKENKDIKSIFK